MPSAALVIGTLSMNFLNVVLIMQNFFLYIVIWRTSKYFFATQNVELDHNERAVDLGYVWGSRRCCLKTDQGYETVQGSRQDTFFEPKCTDIFLISPH